MRVPPAPDIDTAALQHWLHIQMPGFGWLRRVQRLGGGQSNPTYRLDSSGASLVMRCRPAPAASLPPSAHAIAREFEVQRALAGRGVPVAKVHLLCEEESVIGRAFYLMEWIDGRIFWDQALPGLERQERTAIYDEMNRVLAALHDVDVQRAGLAHLARPGPYLARQVARWTERSRAARTAVIPSMERLMEWLPAHLPARDRSDAPLALAHGDYRLDNLVFHPTEPRVLAVLDWELSSLGDPLADLAYHCMAWHIPPGAVRGMAGLNHASLGIPDETSYVERYIARRADPAALADWRQDWPFYLAFNLFRVTAIVQGIAQRLETGIAASPDAAETARCAGPLADLGWRIATQSDKP